MNTKHTPGPWTATKVAPEKYPTGYHGSTYYAIMVNGSRIAQTSGEHLTQDAADNARLIAAAPELLGAAMEALDLLNAYDNSYDAKGRFMLRAVIAKATGTK